MPLKSCLMKKKEKKIVKKLYVNNLKTVFCEEINKILHKTLCKYLLNLIYWKRKKQFNIKPYINNFKPYFMKEINKITLKPTLNRFKTAFSEKSTKIRLNTLSKHLKNCIQ